MISAHMSHTIVHFPRSSTSPSGVPTYGTLSSPDVFFRRKTRRLTDENGNTIISDAHFFAEPDVTINEGDKVTFRSGTYEVIALDHLDDPDEDVYQKVFLRRKS